MKTIPTVEQIARNKGIATERERCALLVEEAAELTEKQADERTKELLASVAKIMRLVAHTIRKGEKWA